VTHFLYRIFKVWCAYLRSKQGNRQKSKWVKQ